MLWRALAALAVLGLFAYWQFILAEGVYLGRRVVVWLYDLGADSYDRIKDYDEDDEAEYLGRPLAEALANCARPTVLDVATGTGRLPLALLRQVGFRGTIIGLDASRRMLEQAALRLASFTDRATLIHHDAARLPYPANHFDAVTCIEALEFLPQPVEALKELIRVLKPGGYLLVTNRVGTDRFYLPGRTLDRASFEATLAGLGATDLRTEMWQSYYDLIWARKPQESGKRDQSE